MKVGSLLKKTALLLIFIAVSIPMNLNAQSLNPRSYVDEGIKLFKEEHFFESIDVLRRAIETNPSYADAYRYLAEVYFAMGEYDSSLENAMAALKYAHKDVDAMLIIANSYKGLGKYKKAEKYYLKVKHEFPSADKVYRNLGELYLAENRFDDAKKMLYKAIRLNPDNWKNYRSLSHYDEANGNIKIAEKHLKHAFDLNSRDRASYLMLAKYYFRHDSLDKAIALIEKGETLFDHFVSGVMVLADSYLRVGRNRDALKKYSWLLDKLPEQDQKERAELYFKMALSSEEIDPKSAVKYFNSVLKYSAGNQWKLFVYENYALKTFGIKSPVRVNLSEWHLKRAKKLLQTGATGRYVFHLKRAVYLYPFNIDARESLFRYYELQKDYDHAYRELKGLFKVKQSAEIEDALEKYDWKIRTGKIKIEHEKLLQYRGYFFCNGFYFNLNRVTDNLVNYYSRYNDRLKFVSHSVRKSKGLNEVMRFVREKNLNFFVRATYNPKSKMIYFELYDRLGKKQAGKTFYFDESRIEELLESFYAWLGKYFPEIAYVEKSEGAGKYIVSMGKEQGVRPKEIYTLFKYTGDFEFLFDVKPVKISEKSSVFSINGSNGTELYDMNGVMAIKKSSLSKKDLTKLKRILVY